MLRLPVSEALNSLPAAAKVEVGNDVNMSAFFCVVKFFRNKLNKCIKRWNMWKIEMRMFVKH